jgi:hypothetical protein
LFSTGGEKMQNAQGFQPQITPAAAEMRDTGA